MLSTDNREAKNPAWLKETAGAFTIDMPREYVNDVLIGTILNYPDKTNLGEQIIALCKKDLKQRVADKPKPPADWSRTFPNSNTHKRQWNILADFLKSSTQQVFNYQALKAKRENMEYAIRGVTIDLKMETIRKVSPHTLRLTKTQDAYKREL